MRASDFAVDGRSPATSTDGAADPDLSNFDVEHDQAYILPRLQEALRLNPGWRRWPPVERTRLDEGRDSMITGPCSGPPSGLRRLLRPLHQGLPRRRIPTHYISMQNEPLLSPSTLPACACSRTSGHSSRPPRSHAAAAGLEDTKILGYDHNSTSPTTRRRCSPTVSRPHLAGTAWHYYASDVVAHPISHNNYPHAPALQTGVPAMTGGA